MAQDIRKQQMTHTGKGTQKAPKVVTEKPPKEKKTRVEHPAVAALGKDQLLEAIPEDFDSSKHAPIKRSQFKEDHLFFSYRAQLARAAAARFDKLAEQAKQVGNRADRAKANKLVKMQAKFAELRKTLEASGIDVDALLATAAAEAVA